MFKHIAWAMEVDTPDALSKWLLVVLADHANEDNICWPSQATLAKRTSMSRRTVNTKLSQLEEAGLISRQSGYEGKSTRYILEYVRDMHTPVQEMHNPVQEMHTKLPVNNNILSEEWRPSDELKEKLTKLAIEHGAEVDHDIETVKFINHHISVGTRFKDINAGYRKWWANAIGYSAKQSARSTNRPNQKHRNDKSQADRWRQLIGSAQG